MNKQLLMVDNEIIERVGAMSNALGVSTEPPRSRGLPTNFFDGDFSKILKAHKPSEETAAALVERVRQMRRRNIAKTAAEVLKEANGGPLKTGELLRLLAEKGLVIRGKIPGNNLSAHLSNSPEFDNTPLGWRLRQHTIDMPQKGQTPAG